MELLKSLDWPGNIIQINAFLERLVLTARHRSIDETAIRSLYDEMFPRLAREAGQPAAPRQSREGQRILEALERNDGNRAVTAPGAGHQHHHLWRKIKKLGIEI